MYADDVTLTLDGSERSLKRAFEILDRFSTISGLNLNYSKTEVIWIGSKKYSEDKLCSEYPLEWGKSRFKMLGIMFDVNLDCIVRNNFESKFIVVKNILKQWKKRNLTPVGKIVVLKSLALPVLNHLFIALPTPDEKFLKELEKLIFSFIWNDKPDRIKRDVLTLDYKLGGLKMINVRNFIKSMKISWVRRLLFEEKSWSNIIKLKIVCEKLLTCGTDYISNVIPNIQNKFWSDVFKAWEEFTKHTDFDNDNPAKTPIFLNKNILIGNSSVIYKTWFDKGIKFINDILDENDNFLKYEDFKRKYNVQTNFIEYNGLIAAIKQWLKLTKRKNKLIKITAPYVPNHIFPLIKSKKHKQIIYITFNKIKKIESPKGINKWIDTFNLANEDVPKILHIPFKTTKNTKLKWFQYRVNHRILCTNKFLNKIGNAENGLCTFCNESDETIEHLLWECTKIQDLLTEFEDFCFETLQIRILFNKQTFLLGKYSTGTNFQAENLILLHTKYYVYSMRCLSKQLSLQGLILSIKNCILTQHQIAVSEGNLLKFRNTWKNWQKLL